MSMYMCMYMTCNFSLHCNRTTEALSAPQTYVYLYVRFRTCCETSRRMTARAPAMSFACVCAATLGALLVSPPPLLHEAAMSGDLHRLQSLLLGSSTIDVKHDGATALHLAAFADNSAAAAVLCGTLRVCL